MHTRRRRKQVDNKGRGDHGGTSAIKEGDPEASERPNTDSPLPCRKKYYLHPDQHYGLLSIGASHSDDGTLSQYPHQANKAPPKEAAAE